MDVLRRYVEQLETTVETMRRRCIAIYDGSIRLGKRFSRLTDSLREIVEPIVYDVKEAVTTAIQDMSPLEPNEMDTRNNLLELYLGCSVLSIGLSAGEISGAFVLGPLYDRIFDWWWEMTLVIMLPCYVYLTFRKNAALDEMERRVNLFWLAMCIGSLIGHLLGNRVVSTMPAIAFIQPLIFGLAVDNELSPPSIYSDRTRLLGIASGAGVMLAALLLLVCGLSLCSIITILLQVAFLFTHFQVVYYSIKNKMYGAGEAQLCYVIATLLLHVIVGGLLGSNAAATQSDGA
ncbi:hypothetical protein Tcan_07666 [Toxocara canis]|uniref:Uncharacterized protein n=1 Tax=Toxocara canis TaxID=6265 RepID=A0A0B2VVQ1_TOXCA|nr:hypothetical protein Tcan_07666 [Toxocara canis]